MQHPMTCGHTSTRGVTPAALVTAVALALALSFAPLQARPRTQPFQAQPLATADGAQWSGLSFGTTTADDIRHQYDTKDCDIAMSVELKQPDTAPRVIALFKEDKKDAPLSAVLVKYDSPRRLSDVISGDFGPAKSYYSMFRTSECHVVVYSAKGLALLVTGEDADKTQVAEAILCPQATIANAVGDMSLTPTPVSTMPERFRKQNDASAGSSAMKFGTVKFDRQAKGIGFKDDLVASTLQSMRNATAHGTMAYSDGADGEFDLTVTGTIDPRSGGMLTVTANISGQGPGGQVTGSGLQSQYMTGQAASILLDLTFANMLTHAMNDAQDDFAANFRKQAPANQQQAVDPMFDMLQEQFRGNYVSRRSKWYATIPPGTLKYVTQLDQDGFHYSAILLNNLSLLVTLSDDQMSQFCAAMHHKPNFVYVRPLTPDEAAAEQTFKSDDDNHRLTTQQIVNHRNPVDRVLSPEDQAPIRSILTDQQKSYLHSLKFDPDAINEQSAALLKTVLDLTSDESSIVEKSISTFAKRDRSKDRQPRLSYLKFEDFQKQLHDDSLKLTEPQARKWSAFKQINEIGLAD
ncbi:MAG: hypothetical protein P4L33_10115 [Capsulimonadaceae bacterium]|nr:hypothetical protein [Capsulimonadaceae bacterium]